MQNDIGMHALEDRAFSLAVITQPFKSEFIQKFHSTNDDDKQTIASQKFINIIPTKI